MKNTGNRVGIGPLKESYFKVPDGYFDTLSDQIMAKINSESLSDEVPKRFTIRKWQVWISAAAAVLVLGWFGLNSIYLKPLQEQRYAEELAYFVEISAGELIEHTLVNYALEAGISLTENSDQDEENWVDYNPDWLIKMNSESIIEY